MRRVVGVGLLRRERVCVCVASPARRPPSSVGLPSVRPACGCGVRAFLCVSVLCCVVHALFPLPDGLARLLTTLPSQPVNWLTGS